MAKEYIEREAGKTWDDIAEPYGISGPTLQKRAGRRCA